MNDTAHWNLVKDSLLLEELAANGFIILHEDTGKEINVFSVPSIAHYVDRAKESFSYKGYDFQSGHITGAHHPFIFIAKSSKSFICTGDITVKVTATRFTWLLPCAKQVLPILRKCFYKKAPKNWRHFNGQISVHIKGAAVFITFSKHLRRSSVENYIYRLRNSFFKLVVNVIAN